MSLPQESNSSSPPSLFHHNYSTIESLINSSSSNYISDLISSIKQISSHFRSISIIHQNEYKLCNREYANVHRRLELKLNELIKKFLTVTNTKSDILENIISTGNFSDIEKRVEDLLEKVSESIDIMKGFKEEKQNENIEHELAKTRQETLDKKIKQTYHVIGDDDFDPFDIDNSYYPFIPKISEKVNAENNPLDERINEARKLREKAKDKMELNFKDAKNKDIQKALFDNPYVYEIKEYTKECDEDLKELSTQFNKLPKNKKHINFEEIVNNNNNNNIDKNNHNPFIFYLQKYRPLNETPLHFIDNISELNNLIQTLSSQKEIAIDLEHHSLESYLGITCLMQISTRNEDYIIDTIKLRNKMNLLNIIFTNPNITKVFHGADYDIEWLQKDFGLYVVNMFDTGQASRILRYSSFALKYLLQKICNIDVDKKYQTADWRIRPLPQEMINYARSDTHYLLYIYDYMKQDLIERAISNQIQENYCDPFDLLFQTVKKSSELCMKSYQKPKAKTAEYYQYIIINSSKKKKHLGLMKEIFLFRDYVARKVNVSTEKVLTKSKIYLIAKLKEFTYDSIYQVLKSNSPLIRYINELIKVINDKKERMLVKEKQNTKEALIEKERLYCEKIKTLLSSQQQEEENTKQQQRQHNNHQMQIQRNIGDINLNYVQAKKEFETFMNNNTNIPSVSFNNSNNNVLTHNNNKSFYCCGNSNNNSNTSKQIVEEVKNELKNFNIISYLKQKHNISAVVVKTSNNSQRNNKMKEMLNHKQKHNERNNFNEENVLKKFKDLTDNANIVKNIQENKIDNEDEHSESISDLDENVNQHVDVSLRKHNKFIKEFRNRPDDIKNYDNTKVYAAKRKKK